VSTATLADSRSQANGEKNLRFQAVYMQQLTIAAQNNHTEILGAPRA